MSVLIFLLLCGWLAVLPSGEAEVRFAETVLGDGGPAVEATFGGPCGLALGADGSLYIADEEDHRIRRIDPAGVISTVAGSGPVIAGGGRGRYSGDGGPATEARLREPFGVAVGPDERIYIADCTNFRIRKVDPDGIISTVAGNGREGHSGDGGPATEASLFYPSDVALAADGSLYIADRMNHRIRKVSPAGIITTVAGNGERGHSGDGGPAIECGLHLPEGVALGPDGALYIADSGNHRIRKVGRDGIILTVAGDGWVAKLGQGRYAGDGGPAAKASLNWPRSVAVAGDGSLFIADSFNRRIRRVDPRGTIATVAGTGKMGAEGDGEPAIRASLNLPAGVALGPDGSVYIADSGNDRIRKVTPDGTIITIAGTHARPEVRAGRGRPERR